MLKLQNMAGVHWILFIFIFSAVSKLRVSGQISINQTIQVSPSIPDKKTQAINANNTVGKENKTVETLRITKPMTQMPSPPQVGKTTSPPQQVAKTASPSQQLEKAISPISASDRTENKDLENNTVKPVDFKPSPQLDIFYEYNRFPVVPALAEPKTFEGLTLNESPVKSDQSWFNGQQPYYNYPTTTEQPTWYNKINFPTTQNPTLSLKNHPYPYVISGPYPESTTTTAYPDITTESGGRDLITQYPYVNYDATTKAPDYSVGPAYFGGYDQGNAQGAEGYHGGHFGGGNSLLQKTHVDSYAMAAPGYGTPSMDTWKQVMRFLTAFIPIGLLISALTPNVINISPMNMTQNKARSEETGKISTEKILSSLNYIDKLNRAGCEERIVCELLMGAGSSSDAERHINNLLQAFTEQQHDDVDKIRGLSKIFQAVKSGNCSLLPCSRIEKNTKNEKITE